VDLLDGGVGFGGAGTGARRPGQAAGDAGADRADETRPMTPEGAALEMAARGRDLLFFVNAETGRPAVVYTRQDGDIAVIDATAGRPASRW
jgi:hypothetical protein